jgi:hypothetical protein
MKKSFVRVVFTTFICGIVFIGCKDDINEMNPKSETQFIEVNGLKAILPNGYKPNDFKELSFDDLFKNVSFSEKLKNIKSLREKDEKVSQLYDFISKEKKKYPDLSKEPLDKNDVKRISKDFPSLKSEMEIMDNSNEVFLYYNSMVRKSIADKYNVKNLRPSGIVDDYFQYQLYIGILAGVNLIDIYSASNAAGSETLARYGTNRDLTNNNNANAFEHCLWNSFSVINLLTTGRSKSGAIGLMADFGVKWELKNHPSESVMFNDNAAVMDLKNNLAARTYMDDKVSWGVFFLRKKPSKTDILTYFGNQTDFTSGYLANQSATSIKTLLGTNATTLLKSSYNYTDRSLVVLPSPHYNKIN